jgi:hypothetical protein
MTDLWAGLFFAVIGLFIARHCSRATIAELKTGRALGGLEYGDYDRESQPWGFWAIIAMNASAALMGFIFLIVGVFYLVDYFGTLT